MSDDGTSFTIDLPVTGQGQIDAASSSIDTLAVRLGNASKASEAANAALKAGEASYRKAEQSADAMAKALERVGLAADVQRGKLRAAQDAGDTKSADRLAAKLRDLVTDQNTLSEKATKAKQALDQQAASVDKLRAAAEKLKPVEEENEVAFEKISRGLNKIGGPIAEVGHRVLEVGAGFGKLGKAMGDTGRYLAIAGVIAAIAAALVAVTAAAAAATVKIAEWAVGLTDANRSAQLLSEGMVRNVKGGQELNDKINYLTSKLPLTREEISSTAQQLAQAGLRGKDLSNALQFMTVRAANLKFGPDWPKQMLSLNEQSKLLSFNLSRIFGGLKIDALLEALQTLGALLDENTASGRAIKVVFESLFQPLIDGAAKSGTKIEAFFLQLEIWTLKALIWLKPHASLILKIGEAFAIVGALVVGTFVVALGILAAAIAAPFLALTHLVFTVLQFKDKFVEAFERVKTYLQNFSLVELGKQMIAGLAAGIEAGGVAVINAIKAQVTGAIDGAKKLLGIASPSKVFAEIGAQTGAGMAVGVDRSSLGVQNSLESMVQPPTTPANPPATSSKSGANISGNTFVFNGVKDAEQAEESFGALLTRLLEGDAAQLGATVPG